MALINIRSLRANSLLLLAYLNSSSLRLIALTETWISPDDTDIFSLFLDIGYTLFISSRTHGRGGGVGVLIHHDLPTPTFTHPTFSYSDCLSVSFSFSKANITFSIYIIYRPPKPDYTTFFNEFNDLILNIPISTKHQITILGDFNYHFHSTQYPHSSFKCLTDSLDMNQVVNFPTHTAGHSLDLIFCRSHDSCNCLINCTKSDLLTDHFIITFTVILHLLPSLSKKLIHYRKIKSINIPLFSSELVSILVSLPISPESINSTLSLLLDKYAPIISTTISLHTNCPWFTPHLVKLKRSLRKTERTYRRMSSPENLLSFTNHRKFYKSQISKAKSSYYINKINSLSSNPRATFALARKLIAPDPPLHIPYIPNIPKNKLCNEFSNFFSNKILSTCSTITSLHQKYSIPCILISKPIDKYLSIFTTPSISNIYDLILKSNSSSPSDPINIYTVKSLASTLSPYLHTIFSSSLSNGVSPPSFKHAIITPILKKPIPNLISYVTTVLSPNFLFLVKYLKK